ncbi:MAG: aspartyl protease family protein [Planctomycetota bacterium]
MIEAVLHPACAFLLLATFISAQAESSGRVFDLPLDPYLDRYLYVRGSLNGTPTDVVLDSGAGITVVDKQLAEQLELQPKGEVVAKGVGSEKRRVHLATATIRIGDLELPDLTVAILDLEEVHVRLGRRMPVILGKELFHSHAVTVDYAGKRVRVHEGAFAAPPGAVSCELRPVHQGHMMVQVEFEDLGPAWCVVDTGAGDTLALTATFVKEHDLLARYPRLAEIRVAGVGGSLPAKMATAGRVGLGGVDFHGVPVTLATEGDGAFGGGGVDGNLGARLLSRFTVTFDYANKRLVLEKGTDLAAPFRRDRCGLALDHDGERLRVTAVTAESPAAAAGLRAGDVIAAIDGVEVTSANAPHLRVALQQEAGTVVVLRDGAGQEHRVTLADYF